MSNRINLVRGEYFSELTFGEDRFVCLALTMLTSPITNVSGDKADPSGESVFELTDRDFISLDQDPSYLDADGNAYYKVIGPRPKNIVRR